MRCSSRDALNLRDSIVLQSTVRDSGGVRILAFASPLDFRRNELVATVLEADLVLGGVESGFGHIADVAGFDDGRFAVLDRRNFSISLFTADRAEYRRFSQKGQGPGELADPLALTRFGDMDSSAEMLAHRLCVRVAQLRTGWSKRLDVDAGRRWTDRRGWTWELTFSLINALFDPTGVFRAAPTGINERPRTT